MLLGNQQGRSGQEPAILKAALPVEADAGEDLAPLLKLTSGCGTSLGEAPASMAADKDGSGLP